MFEPAPLRPFRTFLCYLVAATTMGVISVASAAASGELHIVGPGESVQQAIDRAEPGDVILVQPGIYEEDITLEKAGLVLRAVREHEAVITGIVQIRADDVVLSGMRIEKAGVVNVTIARGQSGVQILGNVIDGQGEGDHLARGLRVLQSEATVQNNVIRNHTGNGIWVETGAGHGDLVIRQNLIKNNRDGLNFQNSDDDHVVTIHIVDNIFTGNSHGGIAVGGWVRSDRFFITGNRIDLGDHGQYFISDWRYTEKQDQTPAPDRNAMVADNFIVSGSAEGWHWRWGGGSWRLKAGVMAVGEGESIQQAIEASEPNARLLLPAGTYTDSLHLTAPATLHLNAQDIASAAAVGEADAPR